MISLVMGTYNGEKFIDECLSEVLSQTIDKDELEIVIVDDGSTDNTVTLLREYEDKYPDCIKLILNDKNSRETLMKTRNIGVEYSSGDYIVFLDQDDKYRKDALELLNGLMNENPDLDYIEYSFHYTDFNGNITRTVGGDNGEFHRYDIDTESKRIDLSKKGILPGATFVWSKIYKKSFLIENNIWHNDGELSSGYSDNYFSGLIVSYVKKFAKLNEPLYLYRNYIGSYSHSITMNDKRQFERCKVGIIFINDCKIRGLYEKNREMTEYIFLRTFLIKTFWKFMKNFDPIPYNVLIYMQNQIRELCPDLESNSIVKEKDEFKIPLLLLKHEWTKDFLIGLQLGMIIGE